MTAVPDWDIGRPMGTDAELVRASAAGDRSAFAGIYDRYANRLQDFCVGMLRDRDGAADCVQDVFCIAATRLPPPPLSSPPPPIAEPPPPPASPPPPDRRADTRSAATATDAAAAIVATPVVGADAPNSAASSTAAVRPVAEHSWHPAVTRFGCAVT